MQKTLGGDRLGSGKKIKVDLHGYSRSTHDLGYLWRSTMSAGTLVPFLCEVALPGDTFDIHLDCDIKTHPTIGPLFGSYKVQLDVFQAPVRLYNSKLHNNAIDIGRNMSQIKLPQIELTAQPVPADLTGFDIDNSQINPSCLLSYLGIRGVGLTAVDEHVRQFNAIPILAYWEIYKNYYANKQEGVAATGYVIAIGGAALVETIDTITIDGNPLEELPLVSNLDLIFNSEIAINFTGTQPIPGQIMIQTLLRGTKSVQEMFRDIRLTDVGELRGVYNYVGSDKAISWRYRNATDLNNNAPRAVNFLLGNIDGMREAILSTAGDAPFIINDMNLEPYNTLHSETDGIPAMLSTQQGLALKTYQSDLFNNWLQTEWIDGVGGITEVTSIDTSGGSFSIDTLNLSRKVYDMLNRIAVSGGTYDDWLDVVYDHDRYQRCESPMYMGGLIKELVFQEVVSSAEAVNEESASQPLGTLAGKGVLGKKHKGGKVVVKVDEPSYIIGLISLTPRIDYSQGNKWDIHLKTMDDFHKPALDEIGFQELLTEQMAWWDTQWAGGLWDTKSAGKQPAWINYMTNVNQTRGNFAIAENEMFMTLNRRYGTTVDGSGGIIDLTTYIDPVKFNFIFAETAIDAQNFWAQIAVDITARRKMSAKIMPNL